jgi:germacradienol/geosmin synthase
LLDGWLWELANNMQNRVPDPIDFIEMRRVTFGSDLSLCLSRISQGDELPQALLRTRPMQAIQNSASDYVGLTNDIFSYHKEIEFEGELNNCVLVIQRFLDLDVSRAVGVVNELMTARIRQFEHIVSTELPALCDDFGLETRLQKRLYTHVEWLQSWMCAVLRWHTTVDRYKPSEFQNAVNPMRLFKRAGGLGTSAMHLSGLFGRGPSGSSSSR